MIDQQVTVSERSLNRIVKQSNAGANKDEQQGNRARTGSGASHAAISLLLEILVTKRCGWWVEAVYW